jgi:glycine hydroxymethyltransferase
MPPLENNFSDPPLTDILRRELKRQRVKLEMIASENFVSEAVLRIGSSVFTNKYAEGYPDNRYYGGCENADDLETLCQARVRKLFVGCEHVNVQPHCGSSANMAAFFSVLNPGDRILCMILAHGGHLTHGSAVSFSGRLFQPEFYGVRQDVETIDYDELAAKAEAFRPKLIIAGGSAYPRIIDFDKFKEVANRVKAYLMVDMAHFAGLVAAGLFPSPCLVADIVTTTTHKTLRGPRGGLILSKKTLGKAIDEQIFPGIQGGPLMHIVAAKAAALGEALQPEFIDYQRQIVKNAQRLAVHLTDAGFRLVSGGTDTHLILVDLRPKNLTGLVAEKALDKAGVTANKNAVPFDRQNYAVTSGLRFGTAALTTRGLTEKDMDKVAEFIVEALRHYEDDGYLNKIRQRVEDFLQAFPLYPNLDF